MTSENTDNYTIDDDSSNEDSPANSQSLLGKSRSPGCDNSSVVIDIDEFSDEEPVGDSQKIEIQGTDSETDFDEDEAKKSSNVLNPKDHKKMEVSESEGNIVQENKKRSDKVQASVKSINEINKVEFGKLKRLSPNDKIFPAVKLSSFHTIAVTLVDGFHPGDTFIPDPKVFEPKWDEDHVPMPCCRENIQVVRRRVKDTSERVDTSQLPSKPAFKEVTEVLWDKIHSAFSEPILNCQDITHAMRTYCRQLRGTELNVLEFVLDNLMSRSESERFFSTVLPGMIHLCLKLPDIVTRPLPFLCRFKNYSLTLSQQQIASLLANAFFCTFPARFEYEEEFPTINFIELMTEDNNTKLASKAQKLRCILHYFERVIAEMPSGLVTYTRKSIHESKAPDWGRSTKQMTKLITLDEGSIEAEGERLLQVDFANRYVGGGVLSRGCVQEEILFVIYPELIVSRLFTEKLTLREALVITGCERFSRYRGYANNFEFVGDFIDCTPWSNQGRKCTQIVAIDALYVTKHAEQFHPNKLTRELNKAYVGFSNPPGIGNNVAVATGKWGCGAFKGDPYLKAVVQLLAASYVDRHVVFFTFGDTRLQKELEAIYAAIKHKTIGEVWGLLNQYYKIFCSRLKPTINLYEFLTEYTSAETAMQDEDDEMETNFTNIPPSKFYKNDETVSSSKRDDERNTTCDDVEFSKDDDDACLEALEKTELNNSIRMIQDTSQPLTDEQICALLENDSPMEEEMSSRTETLKEEQGSGLKSKKKNVPFLKFETVSSGSSGKSLLFSNFTSSSSTAKSPSTTPKSQVRNQTRQTTLKDFYK